MTSPQGVQVVAISGLPGSGKSTLSRALASRLPAARLFHYDDYETITKRPPAEIEAWMARGADPNEIELGPLVAELAEARAETGQGSNRYIVLDTPLGRAHRETARLIDHSVWIALPPNLALARQIGAQAEAVLRERDPDAPQRFTAWLSGFLRNYEAFIHDTYELQMGSVQKQADFTVDGRLPVEKMVAAVIAGLKK